MPFSAKEATSLNVEFNFIAAPPESKPRACLASSELQLHQVQVFLGASRSLGWSVQGRQDADLFLSSLGRF